MNKNKAIQWLYTELPSLERAGIVSQDTVMRLYEYYGPVSIRSRRQLTKVLLGVLGAALIGLGVILLLAHNWDALSRPTKTALSFLPLLAGQLAAGFTLLRRYSSPAWREGSGIYLALSIGASISLISQTYHITGDATSFLLTWIVLAGPLIYLLQSFTVALLYLAGITYWLGLCRFEYGPLWLFLPLALFIVPYVRSLFKENPDGFRIRLLSWELSIILPIIAGLLLQYSVPGVWILVYSGLFCAMLLHGRALLRDSRNNAFYIAGFLGLIVVSLALTYEATWEAVDTFYVEGGLDKHPWTFWYDCGVAVVFLGAGLLPAARGPGRRDDFALLAGAMPLIAAACLAARYLGVPSIGLVAVFNLYLLVFGVTTLLQGLSRDKLLTTNGGMAILSMLIIVRFFDANISFTIRGMLFIALGIAFLIANVALMRRAALKKEVSK